MLVTTLAHGKTVFERLLSNPWMVVDTETLPKPQWAGQKDATLIHKRHCIKMWSVCHRGESYSFGTDKQNPSWPHYTAWAELFRSVWEARKKRKDTLPLIVMHNGNYDLRVLADAGFPSFPNFWDTMISSWLANGNEDKGLKARAPFYGRYIRDTATINFDDIKELAEYAEADVIVADEIYQQHAFGKVVRPKVINYISGKGGLPVSVKNTSVSEYEISLASEQLTEFDRLFLKYQEFQVLKATIRAENEGVPFDRAKLLSIREAMDKDIAEIKRRIFSKAGKVINLNAPKQKVEVLTSLGVKLQKTTASGGFSADFESLLAVKGQHPIVTDMMEYAKVAKMQGTYIGPDGFEHYINPKTLRIHPNLNTVGAVTGRFSSSNPNCFDGSTEYLSPTGWVSFEEEPKPEQCLQYNPETGETGFAEPTAYHETTSDWSIFITGPHLTMCVTPDHDIAICGGEHGGMTKIKAFELSRVVDTHFFCVYPEGPYGPPAYIRISGYKIFKCKEQQKNFYCVSLPTGYIVVRRRVRVVNGLDKSHSYAYVCGQCQNVPARNDKYKMRECFAAPKGRMLVCLDFSQIELRVMAMLSKDPLMCKVLNDPKGDIHTETSTKLHVPRDPVAKQCNFLLIFGGGGYALSHRLRLEGHEMSESEGDQIKANFDRTYHGVPQFRENAFAFHRKHGFIPLLTGRRRVIENIESTNRYLRHKAETQLANNVVQGCLTKESELMLDAEGKATIHDLMLQYKAGKKGAKIWVGKSWETVTDVFSVGKKPLWEVEFDDGSKFRTSDTHLWKDEMGAWVRTRDLQEGAFVQQGMRPFSAPKTTSALFESAGLLVGDGTYSNKDITLVVKNDPLVAKRELSTLTALLGKEGVTVQKVSGDKKRYYLRQPVARNVLRLPKQSGREKKVPSWVFKGTRDERAAFVRGYYLTDGGTSGRAVSWTSCAKKLVSGLQRILHSIGISSRLDEYPQDGETYFRLKVVGQDKIKLYQIIKCAPSNKTSRLAVSCRPSLTNKGDALPPRLAVLVGQEWEATFPRFGSKVKTSDRNINAMLCKFRNGTGSASYAANLPISDSTKVLLGYRHLKVVKVTDLKRKEEMYDLTVEPSHQYCLWNGAVCHNSAQDLMKSVIVRCDPKCLNVDAILPKRIDMGREHRLTLSDYARKVEEYRRLFIKANNKWVLQVHDEVLFECDESAAPEVGAAIADIMTWRPMWEPVYDFCVVVKGDGGWGPTWSAAKKPKDDFHKIESFAFKTSSFLKPKLRLGKVTSKV